VSLKVRVASGCFHREHSPRAYAVIEQQLAAVPDHGSRFDYLEQESGPEVLTWVADGVALAASLISLVVAIIEARHAGVKEGDQPSDPIELVARRIEDGDTSREEVILRIAQGDAVDRERIEALMSEAVARLADGKRSS
jgi:hypothetical protein